MRGGGDQGASLLFIAAASASAYLRTVAILVRHVPDSELPENPYADLSDEEFRAHGAACVSSSRGIMLRLPMGTCASRRLQR